MQERLDRLCSRARLGSAAAPVLAQQERLDRLGGQEQAPALLALAHAYKLVLPPAHNRVVVLRGEVAQEVITAGPCCFQLLPQARLKLHHSMALSGFQLFPKACLELHPRRA